MQQPIETQLETMTVRDLRKVLADLRGGSIGFDPDRHPICKTKAGLIRYIIRNGTSNETPPQPHELRAAAARIASGDDSASNSTSNAPTSLFPTDNQQAEPATMTKKPAAQADDTQAAKVAALLELFNSAPSIDADQVREIVRSEMHARAPHVIEIRKPEKSNIRTDDYRHPQFEKILRLASAGLNVMMVGPAGSGKTTLAANVAHALDLPFSSISLTVGASESQLLGRFLPTGENGTFEYSSTPFMRAYEHGGLFLLDEFDAADGNMAIALNAATSNGHFFNDYRQTAARVDKHENAVIMAACNTYGTGADTVYAGRNQLDAATLDRFYIVRVDYDADLDRSMCGLSPEGRDARDYSQSPTAADLSDAGDWIMKVRRAIDDNRMRRVMSPRATHKAVTAMRAGIPAAEVRADLLAGWTRDEIAKLGTLAPKSLAA